MVLSATVIVTWRSLWHARMAMRPSSGVIVTALEWAFRTLQIRWPRVVEALSGQAVGSLGAYRTIQRALMMLGAL